MIFTPKGTNNILKEIKNAVSDTELLIVIGYSFPYFNRLIDQKIFGGMQISGAKVIIQDPSAEGLVDTIKELRNWHAGAIKPTTNCNQFYVKF